jgi:hypothetical protein
MPKFTVLRRVDAYVDYLADVEADDAEEAALLAQACEDEFDWEESGTQQFDARGFVTLDPDNNEIEDSRCGDW